MKLVTFDEYVGHGRVIEARRELYMNIFKQFKELNAHLEEARVIVEAGTFDDIFEWESIDESIIDRLSDRFNSAIETAKEKGKEALSKTQTFIIKTGGKIGGIIQMMVSAIKKWLGDQFELAKSAWKSAVAKKSDEIKSKVEGLSDEKKNILKEEVKNLKTIMASVSKWIRGGFTSDVATAAKKSATAEESLIGYTFELGLIESLNTAVLNGDLNFANLVAEGGGVEIPYVSTIAAGMNKIPPFSLLYKVKKSVAKVAGGALDKFSHYATELAGAPGPYEFTALATLIGIIGEVVVKGAAKSAIVAAIPGIGTAAYLVSKIAMGLAIVAAIETSLGTKKEEAPE